MADESGEEEAKRSIIGEWREVVESRWRKAGEHVEAYPYVWSSYIVVYGGLGAFLAFKWRKLRKMEDRVRALQEKAWKKAEAAKTTAASGPKPTGTGQFPPLP